MSASGCYHDICTELFSEDKSMLLSIKSTYRYRDVILLFIQFYITRIINDCNNHNEKNKIQHADMTATSALAKYNTEKGNSMLKSLISLIITDVFLPLGMIILGIFFITFMPDYYWVPPTIICIIVYLYFLSKVLEKCDKLK